MLFTLADARRDLDRLRPRIEQFLVMRADLAELRADLHSGGSALGGMAELKALEARVHADLEEFAAAGAHLKGFAPLLLDWPGMRAGADDSDETPVLWCWLEGEPEIGWYHRLDCGFPGRRPV
ncbi:MAG TPA: DUF2203 domain-containing protein [Micromonosporaceae bacterium]|nr:DUF2203 domain-containing protein [Micromonosporaceae bacterium]